MAKKAEDSKNKVVTLKVQLTPEEHNKLRIAAAASGARITQFLQDLVLLAAEQAVRDHYEQEFLKMNQGRSKSTNE
jgi:uncharacterized protein (DUF1778 family)